ncbi:MAG: hypothetical protein D4S02_11380 [Rhodocyclaceae bacterium]|nr:MAG: hypothetical protein D4S02_11380 [Rhodocyclaceae bacterium]
MSFALKELSRLLTTPDTTVGAVVAIDGVKVRVATTSGAMTVHAVETVSVGDRVLIRNGLARRAPTARQSYPV